MTTHLQPLSLLRLNVEPGWIDYNQHMTEGYYGVAFGLVTDALLEYLGFSADYRLTTHCSFYTVEAHIQFQRELKFADPLRFETTLLGADSKRLHYLNRMLHASDGYLAATQEGIVLHVHQPTSKVTKMAPDLLAAAYSEPLKSDRAAGPA